MLRAVAGAAGLLRDKHNFVFRRGLSWKCDGPRSRRTPRRRRIDLTARVREEDCRSAASREVPPQDRRPHRQTPLRAEANDRERVDAAGHQRLEVARGRSDDRAARLEDQVELSNRHVALWGNNRLTEIEPQRRGCPFVDDDRPRRMRRTKCRGDPTDVRLCRSRRCAISKDTALNRAHVTTMTTVPSLPVRCAPMTAAAAMVNGTVATIRLR